MTTELPIDRPFVEHWSERYRDGAAATPWRLGPKAQRAAAAYSELVVLNEIDNFWDLESYIFGTIGAAVRARGWYTSAEFLTVAYWKTRRPLAHYVSNSATDVIDGTRKASSPNTPDHARAGALTSLRGVRTPVASALLAVWAPDDFTIIDVWALKTLSRLGESVAGIPFEAHPQRWWERHYSTYMQACRELAERTGPCVLRDVDRALWKWGQVNP